MQRQLYLQVPNVLDPCLDALEDYDYLILVTIRNWQKNLSEHYLDAKKEKKNYTTYTFPFLSCWILGMHEPQITTV